MTMTDAAAAAAVARAAAEVREALWAVRRAARMQDEAASLVLLQGQEGWLGPAREEFDRRCEALRAQLMGEERELQQLALMLESAA